MSSFDPNFESIRLNMLAQQYKELLEIEGKVTFCAAEEEDCISVTTWTLEEDKCEQVRDSGIKIELIELLDIFIMYRSQCNQLPKREGIVRFGNGELSIEWMPDGFYESINWDK